VNVYLTDIADRARINPPRLAYFGEHLPASTLVEVSALVSPEMAVEIEAQALLLPECPFLGRIFGSGIRGKYDRHDIFALHEGAA
jgi:hypothetical protein